MWRIQTWLGALTPATTMLYLSANVRVWPKPGVLSEPGQRERAPFYAAFFPKWLAKWSGVEPIVDKSSGKLVLGMDPRWKYALRTAIPFLNDWERAYPQAGQLVDDEDSALGRFSYVTGIKARSFDLKKEGMNLAFKAVRAKELISKAAKKRPGLKTEDVKDILKEVMNP